jgi:hypothetical protein
MPTWPGDRVELEVLGEMVADVVLGRRARARPRARARSSKWVKLFCQVRGISMHRLRAVLSAISRPQKLLDQVQRDVGRGVDPAAADHVAAVGDEVFLAPVDLGKCCR